MPTTSVTTQVPDRHDMVALLGTGDELLKLVEGALDVDILVRGNTITLTGADEETARAVHLFDELIKLLDRGHGLDSSSVSATISMVRDAEHPSPSEVLGDEALQHRGRVIRPKTLGQKRYLDTIRKNTVVFGIGPAGTGKTYLAMAMAVLALKRKEVDRLILTRPAVEAGERLGFLPGTLFEKIDPYLRPLFDALHDMMDAEQIATHMERGTIEVAPLAYMRGRAQPVDTPVLTPCGWRPIGGLEVGDLVLGSDGAPTPVLGVYPQGVKPVYRLTAQDGASTVCCGEHLWAVTTASGRRRGKPARVLETRKLFGRLRAAHARRFELPLLSAPAQLPHAEVPLDPYALGLLLGDGGLTTRAPSSTAVDPELLVAVEQALPDLELRARSEVDVLAPAGGPCGLIEDPLTRALRDLGLAGTTSSTTFVPACYRMNSAEVRHAVLQGLLDSDGGPVSRRGRTSRIRYRTTSAQLRDDVIFLVRSLGGVASARTPAAVGPRRGRADGRDAHDRHAAHVVDIRLPAGLAPFRLHRNAARYAVEGGGRPLRHIDRIEPSGEADTVCIQVAAADSLYVTEGFLLTHNTINNSYIVLDEAQNTTPEQMKMFLTRLGFGSKAVITGDITQTDLPDGRRSGLRVVREILTDIDGVSFVELGARDVVRHRIVQEIVEAYRVFDEAQDRTEEKGGRGQ